ncbi:MAG: hypothetical protein ABIH65_01325 [Nanoarchaeota archaeon]
MVNKKEKNLFLNKKISNRLSYTIISLVALILVAVIVYAIVPNPGHPISAIEEPSGCVAGQVLTWTGSVWSCASVSGGGTGNISGGGTTNYLTKFTGASTVGNSIIYDNGINVGIGVTNPRTKLSVGGYIISSSGTIVNGLVYCRGGISFGSTSFICNDPRVSSYNIDRYMEDKYISAYEAIKNAQFVCLALGGHYNSHTVISGQSFRDGVEIIDNFWRYQRLAVNPNTDSYLTSVTCTNLP